MTGTCAERGDWSLLCAWALRLAFVCTVAAVGWLGGHAIASAETGPSDEYGIEVDKPDVKPVQRPSVHVPEVAHPRIAKPEISVDVPAERPKINPPATRPVETEPPEVTVPTEEEAAPAPKPRLAPPAPRTAPHTAPVPQRAAEPVVRVVQSYPRHQHVHPPHAPAPVAAPNKPLHVAPLLPSSPDRLPPAPTASAAVMAGPGGEMRGALAILPGDPGTTSAARAEIPRADEPPVSSLLSFEPSASPD
ncbi:hypothetical protein GCM10025787_41320 [Saccharopolyspora rosea]|uniref:Uncharacterized protein n=1 Tax=Saccharopolyspora rosea TaxID=524884 RepID=A0ABW3FMA9_9PSEU